MMKALIQGKNPKETILNAVFMVAIIAMIVLTLVCAFLICSNSTSREVEEGMKLLFIGFIVSVVWSRR